MRRHRLLVAIALLGMELVSFAAPQVLAQSPSAAAIFAKASPAVVRVEVRDSDFRLVGQGSGFLISEDGLIVTNHHVIEDAYFALVLLDDDVKYFVQGIAGVDREADLALLKNQSKGLPFLELAGPDLPKVGTRVYAIGNPKGLTNTLSEGLVSGHRKIGEKPILIQTSAAISPGSSGGALLDGNGRVVGVTTSYVQGGQNLNFAVPVVRLIKLINNRGELQSLANAGSNPIPRSEAKKLDEVWAAIEKEDFGLALRLLGALPARQKNSALYWFALGYLQSQFGNVELALEAFNSAIVLDPTNFTAHHNLGVAHRALGQMGQAIAAFKKAITIRPDFAPAYFGVADIYSEQKQYNEAIAAYKATVAIDPRDVFAYRKLGEAYWDLNTALDDYYTKFVTEAIIRGDLETARRLSSQSPHPDEVTAYRNAIATFRRALEVEPNDAGLFCAIGYTHSWLEEYQQAIEAGKKAISLDPKCKLYEYMSAYSLLGKAYSALHRDSKAISAYESAVELNPDYVLARDKLAYLKKRWKRRLLYEVPKEWSLVPSPVRSLYLQVKYELPRDAGETKGITVSLYYFDKVATAKVRIEHWAKQFGIDPDTVKHQSFNNAGLEFTFYELSGTLKRASESHTNSFGIVIPPPPPRHNWRVLEASIEETKTKGSWRFVALGPDAQILRARDAFLKMVKSVRRP
ncbi:MAG: tetratricopeptide repeat protein [Planctomycetota bacterium]|nr:tetratricopeptide repeat protein [Planctomycetota bacterium]